MPPETVDAFSRDTVLAGLPARRASTLLYAIERRTSILARRARDAMAAHLTPASPAEREQALLQAVGAGRTEQGRPSAQDLERHAARWSDLVPDDASLRAALARLMGDAYRLRPSLVPGIRAALGLDDAEVVAAFERLHGRPLSTIWAADLPLRERLAWHRSRFARRIEGMPPAVTAFALTFTETVGVGILVLPVAIAGLGVIPGLVLLLALGLLNLVTVGALVEAITRSGPQRYGTAYLGRLVADLLGSRASVVMALALLVLNLVTLLTLYLSFGSALAGSTGIPELAWIGLLFAVDVVIIRRGSLDATVATAILIGVVNVALIALVGILALPHVDADNLARMTVPLLDGSPLDAGVVELVFGVVLMAYFGHTSAANAAKVVLDRDPSGRALLKGNLAAFFAVILIYSLVVAAVIGAVGPQALAGSPGTALTPLAAVVGPSIDVLGTAYVLLAVGLGSIYFTLGLFNQVQEVLPALRAPHGSGWLAALLARPRVRTALGLAPSVAVLAIVTALVVTDRASVAAALGVVGVLTAPLLAGVFPMLLVLAARRRGELAPGQVIGVLGHRAMAGLIIGIFCLAVLLHGLVIWTQPLERMAALAVSVITLAVIVLVVRSGAFHPRSVLELRRIGPRQALALVSAGRPVQVPAAATTDDPSLEVPATAAAELLAWAHRVTPEGDSLGLDGRLLVDGHAAGETLRDGRATTILHERPVRVSMRLSEGEAG